MEYLSLIGSGILVFLIVFCIARYGLKSCLSEYYYSLGWKFMLLLTSGAFLLLPTLIEVLPEDYQVLGFFCCTSLIFVGFAPDYRVGGLEYNVHSIAALLSGVCGIAIAFVTHNVPILLTAVAIAIALTAIKKTRKSWLFWLELIAFSVVITIDLIYNL